MWTGSGFWERRQGCRDDLPDLRLRIGFGSAGSYNKDEQEEQRVTHVPDYTGIRNIPEHVVCTQRMSGDEGQKRTSRYQILPIPAQPGGAGFGSQNGALQVPLGAR